MGTQWNIIAFDSWTKVDSLLRDARHLGGFCSFIMCLCYADAHPSIFYRTREQNTPGAGRALFQGFGWTVCESVQTMRSGQWNMCALFKKRSDFILCKCECVFSQFTNTLIDYTNSLKISSEYVCKQCYAVGAHFSALNELCRSPYTPTHKRTTTTKTIPTNSHQINSF